MEKQLRFAPLIRVSTEQQADKGSSLETQTMQIKNYVSILGGVIPPECWRYKGQEHGTPEYERKLLDQLLEDSYKGIFDCVIVCDLSRWSRDNAKSKQGIEILRSNGIRFFVGTMELNLNEPAHRFILGIQAEVGEFHASEQSKKSIENRIQRAKNNFPSSGKLVWGRTFDKKTGVWGLDPEKLIQIQTAAKLYIETGKGIPYVAKLVGLPPASLHRIFTAWAGDEYVTNFYNRFTGKSETIILKVPPLLDDETIKLINESLDKNKLRRGNRKYEYLLNGYIYCKRCGYRFGGCNCNGSNLFYRHGEHNVNCHESHYVNARELENSVLLLLVRTLGDVNAIEMAVRRATPDAGERDKLLEEKASLEKDLARCDSEKDNLIRFISKGIISEDEAVKQKKEIDDTKAVKQSRINSIVEQVSIMPDPSQVKRAGEFAVKMIKNITKRRPEFILSKPFEWKRELIEKAFAGGKRNGVYLEYNSETKTWTVEIRGNLIDTITSLPLSDDELIKLLNVDTDNLNESLNDARSILRSQYNRELIYIIKESMLIN